MRRINVQIDNQPEYVTSPADLLSSFDLTEVPSGFLLEAGFELLDLSCVDGNPTKTYKTDVFSLHQIFDSIKSMDVTHSRQWSSFPSQNDSLTNVLPVAIALYEYNTLSSTAFDQNLITYASGRLMPSDDADASMLYENRRLVAFAPMSFQVDDEPITLSFNLLDNCNLSYTSLMIDLGDGLGFRSIEHGTSLSFMPTTSGVQDFVLKVHTPEGDLYAYSYLQIKTTELYAPLLAEINNNYLETVSYEVRDGKTISAKISYLDASVYNPQHKTLIIVEGFDPWKLKDVFATPCDVQYGFTYLSNTIDSQNFTLRDYDVYYIDWMDSDADIRDNAQLLKTAIGRINAYRHLDGSSVQSIMLAQSMGGLIAQIALREMEIEGNPHEVGHLFYDDVPFKGVNVPVGLVYAYQSVYNYLQTLGFPIWFLSDIISTVEKYLYGKSTQQMSINYIDIDGTVNDSPFVVLQQYLSRLGRPRGDVGHPIRTYAISDGGHPVTYTNALLHTNGQLLDVSCDGELISFWAVVLEPLLGVFFSLSDFFNGNLGTNILSFLPGLSRLHYDLKVFPNDGNNEILSHFVVVYTNRILGFISVSSTFIDDVVESTANLTPLDNGHTSVYELSMPGFESRPWIDSTFVVSQSDFYDVSAKIKLPKQIAFVPTYSSLNLDGTLASVSRDYYSSPVLGRGVAFDGYHLAANNEASNHTSNVPWDWMTDQLDSIMISSPDTVRVGDVFTLPGFQGTVLWENDLDNLVYIDPRTGRVTNILDYGYTTVTAYHYSRGCYYARKKQVYALPPDFPVLYLETGADENGMYVEIKSPDEDYEEYLDDPTSPVQITWYYKKDSYALQMYGGARRRYYVQGHVETTYDWLRITAEIADPLNPRPISERYLAVDIWCNQRLKLFGPRAIICSGDEILMEGSFGNIEVFDYNLPMLFVRDYSFPPRYSDRYITSTLTLIVDETLYYDAIETSLGWVFPIFLSEDLICRINAVLNNLESPGVGFLRMSIRNSDENIIKDFVLPIIKVEEL